MVLHLQAVRAGRISLIAKNGTRMVVVLGVAEIAQLSTETSSLVNRIHDVPGQLLIVLESERMTNHRASLIVVVLGAIVEEIVQDFEMR